MSKQLNINPKMDKLARENGLGHWSCVSPLSYAFWVRSDGALSSFNGVLDSIEDVFSELNRMDSICEAGKDWQKPKDNLPEKVIVSNGCHDCFFASQITAFQSVCHVLNRNVSDHQKLKTRHEKCSLNEYSIKVVKN